MQVQLFKKTGTYKDKETGKDKPFVNFYLRCGESLIPVSVPYFEGEDGRDYQYQGRKEVLKAFADTLPEKEVKDKPIDNPEGKVKAKPKLKSIPDDDDDRDIPF